MGKVAVAAIVSLWVIPMSFLVNRIVPESYMDEIFHIPQAQKYCNGNFRSWDPMITTPPGLYYLSLAHVASLFPGMFFMQSSSYLEACSIVILRSTNAVLAVLCSILVYEIIVHLRPALDRRKATLYAVVLALYPLHWFFTFLYYTDVASLTAVLSVYLACLKKSYWLSSLVEKSFYALGLFAVFIRQTNIIWVLFVACSGVLDVIFSHQHDKIEVHEIDVSSKVKDKLTAESNVTSCSNLRKRNIRKPVDADKSLLYTSVPSTTLHSGLCDEIQAMYSTLWHVKWELLASFSPFAAVGMAFVAFVYWNGSVVLGAKDAHTVSPHFAQIMYFGLFSALVMAPLHCNLGQAINLFRSFWKSRPLSFVQVLTALSVGFVSVHFFSVAHPYLLADNRHYPFYLWRKVIHAHWLMKYMLVLVYIYSWFSILSVLGTFQSKMWVLAFFLATAAVLVPAPLIEFRYYTIPVFFLMLHSFKSDWRSWLVMGILFIGVNAFTMRMFLFHPFYWDHEPGIQRFIW